MPRSETSLPDEPFADRIRAASRARAEGQPVSWSLTVGYVIVTVVLALLGWGLDAEWGLDVIFSQAATIYLTPLLIAFMRSHMTRPPHRWWATATAGVTLVALEVVASASVRPAQELIRIVAFAVAAVIYAMVTHIPRRRGANAVVSSGVPTFPRLNAGQARRSSGSRNFADVARMLFTDRPSRQPDDDLADLANGATLYISAASRRGRRFRHGRLVVALGADDPVVWQPYRQFRGYGPGTALRRPYVRVNVSRVTGVGLWSLNPSLVELVTLRTDSEKWELAVPRTDLELVRAIVSDPPSI